MSREMSISDLIIARDELVGELATALRSLLDPANADMLKWAVACMKAKEVLAKVEPAKLAKGE